MIYDDSLFDFRFQALTISLLRFDNLTRIQWSFSRFRRLLGRVRGGHRLISSQRHRAGIHSSVGI